MGAISCLVVRKRRIPEALGLDYLPHRTVVFRLPPGAVSSVRGLPFVVGVEYYHPAFKLSPALEPLEVPPDEDPPYRFPFAVTLYEPWGGGTVGTCSCKNISPLPGKPFSLSHGILVTANILANRTDFGQSDVVEGMAPGARVHFQDIGDDGTELGTCDQGALFPPADLTLPLEDAWVRGAFVHNDGWGTALGDTYPVSAADVDQFLWTHPESVVLFPAGDCGPGGGGSCPTTGTGTIGAPGTAKNDLTVGATDQDPNQENVTVFSSRGPETTASGRVGPTLVLVGQDTARVHSIASVNGGQDLGSDCKFASGDCDIVGPPGASCVIFGTRGTSYSTAFASGGLLLIRDYLALGFFPTGIPDPANAVLDPSGPLVKALAINGAEFLAGVDAGTDRFNNDQDYGRLQLTNTLPLAGDPRTPSGLAIWDRAREAGLGAAETARTHVFQVEDSGREVRVSLAYYDPPSPSGSAGSLINDLSLSVRDPAGNLYRGNQFLGAFTLRNGGVEDGRNPTEMVVIDPAELVPGIYAATVQVGAGGVNQGHPVFGGQPYALVASGNLTQLDSPGLGGVPGDHSNPENPLTLDYDGSGVTLTWAASCLDQDYVVYRGNLADLPVDLRFRL